MLEFEFLLFLENAKQKVFNIRPFLTFLLKIKNVKCTREFFRHKTKIVRPMAYLL